MRIAFISISAISLLLSAVALGDFEITWHKIAGGGETFSTGDAYSLGGTIGQHDAGEMAGGDYELSGGFWAGVTCPNIVGDLNCDGVVDGADLLILLSAWGECDDAKNCPEDLNDDGFVDGADLLLLLSNWG
jgi:hypothetical protein